MDAVVGRENPAEEQRITKGSQHKARPVELMQS